MEPSRTNRVVVVGGGIVGTFCALELRRAGHVGTITVAEMDASYARSSTALSAASIRTQFVTPVSILGTPDQVDERRAAAAMQCANGADIEVLEPEEVLQRFPYLDLDGIAIATFGATGEGWFDAWSLLSLVRRAARRAGVEYVEQRVMGLHVDAAGEAVVGVRLASGDALPCDVCVLAAGAQSGRVAALVGIDLPVVPRKRSVFNFRAPVDGSRFPMLFDTSGLWVRSEGDGFIGGIQPPPEDDPDADGDFEPHPDLFEDVFWPLVARRVPAMDEVWLRRSWAGHYEANLLDHNAVIGPHDRVTNLLFATGFSGHGLMHAPATGRAIAELVTAGRYTTIDLSPFGWQRIRDQRPLVETIVY
jgi:FAD-dependent oxidoreductase domain-containing protein 1